MLTDAAMKYNNLIDPLCLSLPFELRAQRPIAHHMEFGGPRNCTSLNQPIKPLVTIQPANEKQPQGLLLAPKMSMATFLTNLAVQPLLQLPQATGQHEHFLRLYALLNKNLSQYR
jgi:hypothetical protein